VTVDAMVVAVAAEHGAREIILGDPADIAALAGTDISLIEV
jgi:hypothetical protein